MKIKLFLVLFSFSCLAQPDFKALTEDHRETLAQLVKADTTNPPGNEARAVAILGKKLKAERIPFEIVEFGPNRQNLIARLKGDGSKKPLLLLAHIDVVGTKDQSWSTPPHKLTEKDGFLYGRGVMDDFGMAVTNLQVFLTLKREKIHLKRDVILAYTGDEEAGGAGIRAVFEKRPELLDAEIALNEGSGISLNDEGNPAYFMPQVAEKTYQDFILTATGQTGHSSVPRKDNAIYKLARALDRLDKHEPEYRLLPVTRAYLEGLAKVERPERAKVLKQIAKTKGKIPKRLIKQIENQLEIKTQLHTSCVATMIHGGTRENALPAIARATVNCRLLPDESAAQIYGRLEKIVDDPGIKISIPAALGSAGASPLDNVVMTAIKELADESYAGIPVIPLMISGATDSRYLRARGIAAYGFNGMPTYEKDSARSHGIDERIPAASIRPAIENMYKLVLKLAH